MRRATRTRTRTRTSVPLQRTGHLHGHVHADGCWLDDAAEAWVCPEQRPACTGDPCRCGALVTPWSHHEP